MKSGLAAARAGSRRQRGAHRARPADEVGADRHRAVHAAAGHPLLHASSTAWAWAFAMSVIMVVAGFLFCSVSAYMAGLVGSSNNPVSGITIATILFAALVLLRIPRQGLHHRPGGRGDDRRGGVLRRLRRRRQPAGSQGRLPGRRHAVAAAGDAGHRFDFLRAGHGADAQPAGEAYGIGVAHRAASASRCRRRRPTLMASVAKRHVRRRVAVGHDRHRRAASASPSSSSTRS